MPVAPMFGENAFPAKELDLIFPPVNSAPLIRQYDYQYIMIESRAYKYSNQTVG